MSCSAAGNAAFVTGNLAAALEVFLIDRHHHVDHLARCYFRLFVVFLVRMRHVAILAFDSKRSRNELHRGNHLIRRNSLQRLNILELLFREFRPCGRRRTFRQVGLRPCSCNRKHEA